MRRDIIHRVMDALLHQRGSPPGERAEILAMVRSERLALRQNIAVGM